MWNKKQIQLFLQSNYILKSLSCFSTWDAHKTSYSIASCALCWQEGAFLVRDCSKNTTQEPYVLALFYDNRVFNVQIRFSKETGKYTLGTRIKTDDVSSVMVSGFPISHWLHSEAH